MKLNYVNGDRLSYIPHCCNTGNVSAMRCPDARIFFRTDCVEGNDRYTLLIDQVAKLKEENERLKIENQMLDSRHKVWKIKVCDMLDEFQDAVYNTEEGLNWRPNPEHRSWFKETDCSLMYDLIIIVKILELKTIIR